ncbi:MAG TPA: CHRD domain-containing protein [Gemmatimonadales bacterium]|nr:CHRD domain-containing protein [Gemmatimonadales bacterium]
MRTRFVVGVLSTLFLVGQACEDEVGPAEVETFTAALSGAAERPNPVTTTATGSATISIVGPTLLYRIDVANISNVTAAHIHGPADTGGTAGVRVNLCGAGSSPACATGTVNGVLVAGSATNVAGISFDSLVVLLRNRQAYVNVHTSANPGGEIRGQVVRP